MHVINHAPKELGEVGLIGHQPACLHVITKGLYCRQAAFFNQIDDELPIRKKLTRTARNDRIRRMLGSFAEYTLIFGRRTPAPSVSHHGLPAARQTGSSRSAAA